VAEKLGVSITGTVGILARARREGLIPNVREDLDRLQSHGTWIHPRLRQDILELLGEG
jgi:predicted nucleic acid-binding protein